MPNLKEGDRVKIISRPVTEEDRKKNLYYDHMGGLTGVVENVYSETEIAVKIDLDTLSKISRDTHTTATDRLRSKFLESISEEQKKMLTTEELNFEAHYMLLVMSKDLEKI